MVDTKISVMSRPSIRSPLFIFALFQLLSFSYGYSTDDEQLSVGSGSGYDSHSDSETTAGNSPGKIRYATVDIRFSTKNKFATSPSSVQIYHAEVCDDVTSELNMYGGPMPDVEHRPTMVNCSSLRRTNTEAPAPGAAVKFRVRVQVPLITVDEQDLYLERIDGKSAFFSMLKSKSGNSVVTKMIPVAQLLEYESTRLPNPNLIDVEVSPGNGDNKYPAAVFPDNTNSGNVDVVYPKMPTEFFSSPATLAAIVAAAVAGLFCTILCSVFVVYRMRKKDEGSYALDEPKHKYKHEIYPYFKFGPSDQSFK